MQSNRPEAIPDFYDKCIPGVKDIEIPIETNTHNFKSLTYSHLWIWQTPIAILVLRVLMQHSDISFAESGQLFEIYA